ncbi:MAG: hypothetical protein ACLPHP_19800 [Candidatus Sulfotelmatobacter sp.]
MKRLTLAATLLLLFCISFPLPSMAARHKVPRFLNKESSVDMSKMNHIFVGWVDLGADDWALWGYENKQDWADVIASLNSSFSRNLVPGRTITSAKDKGGRERGRQRPLYQIFRCPSRLQQLSLDSLHTFHRSKNRLRNCHDSGETLLRERLGSQELSESGAGRSRHEGASGSHGRESSEKVVT